jgi:hypothetical protein
MKKELLCFDIQKILHKTQSNKNKEGSFLNQIAFASKYSQKSIKYGNLK